MFACDHSRRRSGRPAAAQIDVDMDNRHRCRDVVAGQRLRGQRHLRDHFVGAPDAVEPVDIVFADRSATPWLCWDRSKANELGISMRSSQGTEIMIEIRKIITTRETVFSELGVEANRPITRAVGMAVIRNPFAGQFVEDLRPLFEAGAMLGERLMPELVKLPDGPAISYGKGAIVGVAGEMEHGGACVHPMLGKPMRAAIGGGKAVIGSNVKVAAAGAMLDVPLGHKDDSWSFPHFDTITVTVADAPR
jgi:hypothetical protein